MKKTRGRKRGVKQVLKTSEEKSVSSVDGVVKAVSEKFGGRVCIRRASELSTCFDLRRPTGITSVDVRINGGFCAGATNILYGPAGIGKDLLADLCMAQIQKNYGDDARILVASFGYQFDIRFAQRLGVAIPWSDADIAALERDLESPLDEETKASLKREVGRVDILAFTDEVISAPAESIAEGVLEAVRSREYQLIILNELGAQLTSDGASKTIIETSQVGDTSRFFDKFFKWYFAIMNQTSSTKPNETTLLLISQVRSRFGPYMSWNEYVGGNPTKHAAAIALELSHGRNLLTNNEMHGKEIKCTVRKNKHGGREGETCTFVYDFAYGVDFARDLFDTAMEINVITREEDSPYYVVLGKRIKGLQKTLDSLADPEFYNEVRKQVFSVSGVTNIRYR